MNMETAYCGHPGNGTYHLDHGDGINTVNVVNQTFPLMFKLADFLGILAWSFQ